MTKLYTAKTVRQQFTDDPVDDVFDPVVTDGVCPDDWDNNTLYEFSVAPKCQFYEVDQGERFITIHDSWSKLFASFLGDIAEYSMITEIAYPKFMRFIPGARTRIHFHGTVKFTDLAEFLGERAHHLQEFCTFKISHYREDAWPKYISKQEKLMSPKLGRCYRISNPPILKPDSAATFTGAKGSSHTTQLSCDDRAERGPAPPREQVQSTPYNYRAYYN